MPVINQDELNGVLTRITTKLGKDKAQALSMILADPDFRDEVLLMGPRTKTDGQQSSLELHDFIAGQLERKKVVAALRGTIFGMHERLPLRSIANERTPSRPPEELFTEALRGLCGAKRALPAKMANADFDIGSLEAQTDDIEIFRDLTEIALRFTGTLMRNLAVREDAACQVLKDAYPKVREAAKADDTLGVYLGVVEDYLYGAAQEAADTRVKMDGARKEAFAAGEQQALRTAERNVRKGLADEILSLSEDLRRSVETSADDRARPR